MGDSDKDDKIRENFLEFIEKEVYGQGLKNDVSITLVEDKISVQIFFKDNL